MSPKASITPSKVLLFVQRQITSVQFTVDQFIRQGCIFWRIVLVVVKKGLALTISSPMETIGKTDTIATVVKTSVVATTVLGEITGTVVSSPILVPIVVLLIEVVVEVVGAGPERQRIRCRL